MFYKKNDLFLTGSILRKESSRMLKIHVNKYKRANILCANLHYPGEGLWNIKVEKCYSEKNVEVYSFKIHQL